MASASSFILGRKVSLTIKTHKVKPLWLSKPNAMEIYLPSAGPPCLGYLVWGVFLSLRAPCSMVFLPFGVHFTGQFGS